MKRQRGRGRKPGGGSPGNRPLESNGPDVKIRGTAAQIYEKYSQYARDAQSSGDRVKYENYLQHAEHYFRIMVATMPRDRILQQQEGGGMGDSMRVMDDQGGEEEEGDFDAEEGGEGGGESDRVEAGAPDEGGGQGERQGRRRRRGRRRHHDGDRMGNGGGGGGGESAGGGSALDSLARKQGALAGG